MSDIENEMENEVIIVTLARRVVCVCHFLVICSVSCFIACCVLSISNGTENVLLSILFLCMCVCVWCSLYGIVKSKQMLQQYGNYSLHIAQRKAQLKFTHISSNGEEMCVRFRAKRGGGGGLRVRMWLDYYMFALVSIEIVPFQKGLSILSVTCFPHRFEFFSFSPNFHNCD